MSIKNLCILFLIILLSSCEKEINWNIKAETSNSIVVDAILTNEYKYQEIRLSHPKLDINTKAEVVSGAIVNVSNESDTLNFIEEPDRPGIYKSEIEIAATLYTSYHLNINYNAELYEANAYMIPVNSSDILHYTEVADSTDYYEITWIANEFSFIEQAMYEIDIDWSGISNNVNEDSITKAKLFFYTFNTVDVSYSVFPQDKEKVYFPKGSKITEKKYSLTDEYASYLRALLAETEWQGSLFENARANLPGNISNKGLGYFSVCSVISDTLTAQ